MEGSALVCTKMYQEVEKYGANSNLGTMKLVGYASLAAYQETRVFCSRRAVPGPNGKSSRAAEKVNFQQCQAPDEEGMGP